jgi:peroxiredoxin
MKRKSKIALVATGLVAASAVSYVMVMGLPAATPVLADIPIGKAAPDFQAMDANGRAVSLSAFAGKTVVLEWNNPDCPTVKEHYQGGIMQKTQAAAAADGVVWLTVNSSGPWKQGHMDGAEAKAYVAEQKAHPTAYLLDPEGKVGISYGAKTTPHMFVINETGTLVYKGAVRGGMGTTQDKANVDAARNHVLAALSELKAGKPVSVPTTRPYGCSVKYS